MKTGGKFRRLVRLSPRLLSQQTTIFSFLIAFLIIVSLTASLFFKEPWLWMDEVTSYVLLSDPSWAHLNDALVSNLDAHPPVYFNFVWTLAHGTSLSAYFLRALSILFFAVAVALFYRHTTRLIGMPLLNFLLFTGVLSLTYLNYTLATELRSYGLYLLMSCFYFLAVQPLIKNPAQPRALFLHWLAGSALVMTHNFGNFYVVCSLGFFALLYAWSGRQAYWWVAASHLLIGLVWFTLWYGNFQIQSLCAEPYSWIPKPTFTRFFRLMGELVPTLSYRLEQISWLSFLPVVRVTLVLGLFLYIALPRLKQGYAAAIADDAFSFYLFSGTVTLLMALGTTVISYAYLSVYLSRFQWPSHLLLLFQLTYACYYFVPNVRLPPSLSRFVPLYVVLLAGFMFYQNQKIVHFPSSILHYLPRNDANYPIFFESADYFLPIWHHKLANAHYLLDRKTALAKENLKNSATDYNILTSLREKYNVPQVIRRTEFKKDRFPHFYVVDEASRYQIDYFIASHQVKVIQVIPVPIKGHRIIECVLL